MSRGRRVVILGGGMAGLTAAWELSRPGWRDDLESITVYQRGGRLGGKGASSRGVHDRIEEHGLHVWMGYYENAFRLLRQVYAELDRPSTDPGCPIRTIDDAFTPAGSLGVGDHHDGEWSHWTVDIAPAGPVPGAGDGGGGPATVSDVVRRAARLLPALLAPPAPPSPSRPSGIFVTGSATPPGRHSTAPDPLSSLSGLRGLLRQAEVAGLVVAVEGLAALSRVPDVDQSPAGATVLRQLDEVRATLTAHLLRRTSGRRLLQLADLAMGCIRGAVADGLLRGGFASIDHRDFREWLTGRVDNSTLDSPFIRGLYDLVFAYEGGRRDRPRFSAGLGLFLAGRLFFDYEGAIFWKMQAGMGEVVFAPLYQALVARGVDVQLFHRLDAVVADANAGALATIRLGRQAGSQTIASGLVDVGGLPCFRSAPTVGAATWHADPESHWCDRTGEELLELRAGHDFDVAVLAVSLGMVPHVAADLVERRPEWRRMVDEVATVATQALQVWAGPDEATLGWEHPSSTVSAYAPPFDTYASMSHLVAMERWPQGARPATIGYFCGALADAEAADPATAEAAVRANAQRFLDDQLEVFWPHAADPVGGLRPGVLCGDDDTATYVRANVDPSDRYVQSLPGSGRARLRPDQSGVEGLVLAGDWTRCGLDAGCIEAAVMSGIEAANVVAGRPLTTGLAGRWHGLDEDLADAAATRG